ncbi:hypothetical protein OPV22_011811 [Ensete ventricosum]|uniref:DUF1639 domain-containing protein n=1 Tax=Ensete ventricosum TaxID=4639 RepID=A0AAV8RG76_ENSVE|nr:hypothetical protein OPV22_011811 [Ensete ventricosum]
MVIASGEEEDRLAVTLEPREEEHCVASSRPPKQPPPPRLSRSRLHNFTFPTGSWGSHRILRCCNLPPADASRSVNPAAVRRPPSPPEISTSPPKRSTGFKGSKDGKGGGWEESEPEISTSAAVVAAEAAGTTRPWNLRTRRAACNAPSENGQYQYPISAFRSSSPLAAEKRCLSMTEMVKGTSDGSEKRERRKFSISLSREEIDRDFWVLKGTKPPRRPKKRPRIVQRRLDSLFPGLWLSEVTPETYKVDD